MNEADKKWLARHFGHRVLFDEPMSGHTTFGIGGPADALLTLKSEQQIEDLVKWARNNGHHLMIVGAGSNLLVRDGGIRGLVLKLSSLFETIEERTSATSNGSAMITAGAGVLVRKLGKYALDRRLAGLNFALGIPGTVGGALRMNAGAWGACMADITSSIAVLNKKGEIVTIGKEQLRFSYRRLDLEEGSVILRGRFELKRADRQSLRDEAIKMQRKRRSSQPLSFPSAGCIFRNSAGGVSAGELIDKAGLKGLRVGRAEISTKHSNFIVNRGGAKASDVLALIRQIRENVLSRFGIELEPEVTIVGEEAGSQKLL
ncbi:MAG: UDP-N-acetylmuramate dehydrogenase [Desulfobacterales bacterium]|nr:UDP-N-acetylmuramate dehydrogenase [Desulfobacterales bacterium]